MSETTQDIQVLNFGSGKTIPNNPGLPVLIYHQAKAAESTDLASWWNQTFSRNGWRGLWRWTVFDYHHFHPDAHEVLGVARGSATLQIGGPEGSEVEVRAGDALLLPAGTGHKRLRSTAGFQVIGAYPPGQERYTTKRELPEVDEAHLSGIREVPLPVNDPVWGKSGPLHQHWKRG